MKYLIEKGANVEEKENTGTTPLLISIQEGKLDVVKYLIEKGANIDAKTNDDSTPLCIAA